MDIVAKLRDGAAQAGHYGAWSGGVLLEQAADEIEALRREQAQNTKISEAMREALEVTRGNIASLAAAGRCTTYEDWSRGIDQALVYADFAGTQLKAAAAPLRAVAQVVALEPEGPDGHGVNWLAGKRPKPGDLLYGGDAVARALAAKNEAETNALKAAQEADELRAKLSATLDALADEVETSNTLRLQVEALGAAASTAFVPLRAHGVLDADDNLDCWDTPPFELARRHVEALNAKDPAAMWRVAQLYVLGPNA